MLKHTALALAVVIGAGVAGQRSVRAEDAPAAAPAPTGKKRREPPPAVIPTAETLAAQSQYKGGNYDGAVAQAKAALNKNERYTPAMLIMAKAYYKLHKYEWVKTLWEMMQANGASDAEKSEIFQILAFMELEKQNVPGAIELLKKAADSRPDNGILWNNLGAQYLAAKNYKDAVPALERSVQLQPAFAKAFLNLGSAYRGVKEYEKSLAAYQRALQLFSNYADAVFNLGILYLDADKMPNADLFAQMNTAIGYFQKYKQMMGSLPANDPTEQYIAEAQGKIQKEQKRLERLKKQEEREKQRAAQKAAADAAKTAGGAAPAGGAPAPGATPAGGAPPAAKPDGKAPVIQ